MSTRLLALLAVLALVACQDGSEPQATTGTVSPPTTADGTTTTTSSAGTTTAPTSPETTLPEGTDELPEEVRAELADLISVTEQVRQLTFQEPPQVVVVTSEELEQRVRDRLADDLEDLPADQALYRLLGLIDADTDLEALYTDLYSEQVVGFYDGEEGELVVPRAEEGFTLPQRATLVHELTHALTQQHYGFQDRYASLLDEDRYDEAAAMQGLIEGDAVLAQLLYLQGLSPEEQADFLNESFEADQDVLESAPRFIRQALQFPYDSGFLFVQRLFQSGGFGAVADAYASPPSSTEQIIDPEDYPADQPVEVELESLSVDGYDLEYESTWGELGFALMFDQILDTSTSDTAAGGWGGDSYQVHFDGDDVALVLRYRGDAASDGEEMEAALVQYVETGMDVGEPTEEREGVAYRGEDAAWIWRDGTDVMFVASSAPETVEAIVDMVGATTTTTDGS